MNVYINFNSKSRSVVFASYNLCLGVEHTKAEYGDKEAKSE